MDRTTIFFGLYAYKYLAPLIIIDPVSNMTVMSMLTLLLTHPDEFRILVQFWLYHEQKRDISAQQEHPMSGWDRESMRRCWKFLDLTSRSFSAVIKELDGDLARTVSRRGPSTRLCDLGAEGIGH